MNNYTKSGDVMTLTAPYARDSGQPMLVGSFFGVATADVASGSDVECLMKGVMTLDAKTSQAWTKGDKLYWDDSAKVVTSDGTKGLLVGAAAADKGSSAATGSVRVNGTVPAMLEGPEAAVADLAGTLTGTVDGTMVDVAASAGNCAGTSSPSAGNVDTAIATAVASIVTGVNTQNKEVLTKLNALLAALRLNGVIAP